ncbi:MAG TPA: hypothetical protein VFQ90_07320 [Stellaceae bacterium]|jgi:hypothetical protein|nr:hypothetical protein [Stellaceae bacterium]
MTAIYAPIGRMQRERGGLVVEATLPGADHVVIEALKRAVGRSLGEMDHGGIAGRLLNAVAKGAGVVMHLLLTSTAAAEKVVEHVYKGVEVAISLFGDEISEIALVDRPLNKFSGAAPKKIAVLYKRSEAEMSITSAVHKYYDTRPSPSDAEINAVWVKLSPTERVLLEIRAARRTAVGGDRNVINWLIERAAVGAPSGADCRLAGERGRSQ